MKRPQKRPAPRVFQDPAVPRERQTIQLCIGRPQYPMDQSIQTSGLRGVLVTHRSHDFGYVPHMFEYLDQQAHEATAAKCGRPVLGLYRDHHTPKSGWSALVETARDPEQISPLISAPGPKDSDQGFGFSSLRQGSRRA